MEFPNKFWLTCWERFTFVIILYKSTLSPIVWQLRWAYRTSCPHQRGWSFGGHRVGRWPGPPESSAQCRGSKHLLHHSPGVCQVHPPAPRSHPWGREPAPTLQTWWDYRQVTRVQRVECWGLEADGSESRGFFKEHDCLPEIHRCEEDDDNDDERRCGWRRKNSDF